MMKHPYLFDRSCQSSPFCSDSGNSCPWRDTSHVYHTCASYTGSQGCTADSLASRGTDWIPPRSPPVYHSLSPSRSILDIR